MAVSFCRRSLLNFKNSLYQIQKRTGYVILIPETPEEVADCNVVSVENLPNFELLTAKSCNQIVNKYAQKYDIGAWELDDYIKKKLQKSEEFDVFRTLIDPLEVISVPFLSSWGIAKTLYIANQNRMPNKYFVPLSERVLEIRSDKFNINSIYRACKKHLETQGDKCTDEQKRILQKFVWEGTHNGFELDEENQASLRKCLRTMHTKRQSYENKLKNAKMLFKQVINDKKFIDDSPSDLLRNTASNPDKPNEGPWVITLTDSVYWRFLQYCGSRDARRHIWLSYNQLCSIHGDRRCDASIDVNDILRNRKQFANLVGFPSYAHLSMRTKMAGSVENVQNVFSNLLEPAKYAQEKEIYELEKFAYIYDFKGNIELWDLLYWKRMQQKHVYNLDENLLQDYFPLSQVLLGLIALCEQLFDITIEEQSNVSVWDPDVRYFRICDGKNKTHLGGFYLDPYARSGKIVGEQDDGWFMPITPRSKTCASLPLSSIIFSFSPPTEDKPSLLYFTEVKHLFGKFGTMLQYTLTQMNYSEVSGLANIEWDAVEVCSKFLQCWLCERSTLESISGHYNTGDPIPSKILDNLCNIDKHMAGTELSLEIYFSNLDLELHLEYDNINSVVEKLWSNHLLFQKHDLDDHAYGFKEIFLNPWGSSFFSRVWSKMVALDAFYAFIEVGLSNQEQVAQLGKRFRSTFLALGGGCHPGEIFRRFRGRNPSPEFMLEHLNLKVPTSLPAK